MEKYGTNRQGTDDNMIRRTCIACWITKATDTHSEYVIIIVFLLEYCFHLIVVFVRALSALLTHKLTYN